jgi:hypothetical protein
MAQEMQGYFLEWFLRSRRPMWSLQRIRWKSARTPFGDLETAKA